MQGGVFRSLFKKGFNRFLCFLAAMAPFRSALPLMPEWTVEVFSGAAGGIFRK